MRLLVTGLTGQLGHGVVEVADGRAELVPLVRPTARRTAADRVARAFGPELAERTVEGDVSQSCCGVAEADLDRLAGEVDGVLNLAGEVDWTAPDHAFFATNVLGALHALELARALHRRGGRCRLLCHASSIHVAGGLSGRVAERRLGPDGARTRYEHSKWHAEEALLDEARDAADGPAILVARVGGLVGSSVTGETVRRTSLYMLADEWDRLPGGLLPAFGDGRVDMLPRDTAAELLLRACAAALDAPAGLPEVVHVAAGEAAPRTDAVIALARSLDVGGRLGRTRQVPVPGRALLWLSQHTERFADVSRERGNALAGLRYLAVDRVFERDRLAALVGSDLPAPGAELLARLAFGLEEARPRPAYETALARFAG